MECAQTSRKKAEHAYIIVVPDPAKSRGIKIEHENYTHLFWFKIGDGKNIVNRASDYKNPSQHIRLLKFINRPEKNPRPGPGKDLELTVLSKHRMGGMIPGGSSEWRALYGTDKLAEKLFDMLENFCFYGPRNETTKEAWLSSVKNNFKVFKRSKWDDVVNTLKVVTDQAIGPGLDLSRPRPPRFPMITIVVTPSTHQNALNLGFTDRDGTTYTYWIKISRNYTQNEKVFLLLSNSTSRTERPDLAYNGFILPEKDAQTDEQEHDTQVKNIVKKLKKTLNEKLAPYKFEASAKEDSHGWYSVTCSRIDEGSDLKGGVAELRDFVNTFDKFAENFVSKPGGNNNGSEDKDERDGSESNGEDDDDDDEGDYSEGDHSEGGPYPDEGGMGESTQQAFAQMPVGQGVTWSRLRMKNLGHGLTCVTGIDPPRSHRGRKAQVTEIEGRESRSRQNSRDEERRLRLGQNSRDEKRRPRLRQKSRDKERRPRLRQKSRDRERRPRSGQKSQVGDEGRGRDRRV